MKNILIVIASLRHGGWAEKVASTIGTRLSQNWYTIHYLTFYDVDHRYDFEWTEICLNEKLSRNPLINIWKLFRRAWKIKQTCKKLWIDTSVSFMEEANFSNILSKRLFLNTSKVIISIHNSINTRWTLYNNLARLLYRHTDRIITIVAEDKQNLIHNYRIKPDKIVVINNTIATHTIEKKSHEPLREYQHLFDQWIFTFINIGRLTHQKNQALLIDAFKSFYDQYPQSQLLILWEWELRPDLESQIWDHPDIHLLWNQSNPYKFLKHADCFVLSSRHEWMPVVLLEALACGLPIISSDCPTWPKEILWKHVDNFEPVTTTTQADYGVLVPIEDKSSLLQAMTILYKDENLRNSYAQKSLTRAKDFELDTIIKQRETIL